MGEVEIPAWFKLVAERQREKISQALEEEVRRFERKFNVVITPSDVHEKVTPPFVSIEKELSMKVELPYGMRYYLRAKICNNLRYSSTPSETIDYTHYDEMDKMTAEIIKDIFKDSKIVELVTEHYYRLAVQVGTDFIIVAEYRRSDC